MKLDQLFPINKTNRKDFTKENLDFNRTGYETELLAAKVAAEEARENRFVTELEDKSSQVEKLKKYIYGIVTMCFLR